MKPSALRSALAGGVIGVIGGLVVAVAVVALGLAGALDDDDGPPARPAAASPRAAAPTVDPARAVASTRA